MPGFATALDARADAKQCVQDHTVGLDASRDAKLVEAKRAFLACASDDCPDEVREECARLSQEVGNRTPSVVVAVTDSAGADVVDARVLLDGKQVATRIDGRAIILDPGIRNLEVTDGERTAKARVVIREGEKTRPLMFRFETPAKDATGPRPLGADNATADTETSSGVPTAAWIAGGVGIVALGGFGYFAVTGRAKENDLESCSPLCSQDEYDSMKQRYLFADIALGIGVAALGTAAVLVLTAPNSKVETAVAARATPGGGRLSLQGAF